MRTLVPTENCLCDNQKSFRKAISKLKNINSAVESSKMSFVIYDTILQTTIDSRFSGERCLQTRIVSRVLLNMEVNLSILLATDFIY
jgi:hypothetical protein